MKQMDPTKIVVSGTEWFSSLALLNLCWLLFSLPLITIIPATDTVFELVNQWEITGRPKSIFRHFKETFKTNFKTSYQWGLPFFAVLFIIGVDIYILKQITMDEAWFHILKYAFYTFSLLITVALFYAYPLSKRSNKKSVRVFVSGFLTVIGNPLLTGGVVLSFIALAILFSIWPALLFFFSVSGPAWLMTKAVSQALKKLEEKQSTEHTEQ